MQKILVDLQNCYGIKSLKAEFDFSKARSVAIYAPNGAMKSSFAQTFMDVATGESSRDRIFPKRVTSRKITDHQNKDLKSDNVVVLRCYVPRPSAGPYRIAGDAELLKDYVALQKSLGMGWQPAASGSS